MVPLFVIEPHIPVPDHSRQLAFQELLASARKTWLIDALVEALGEANPDDVRNQASVYVPNDVHIILSQSGIPDEHVIPLPALLEVKPSLVAYYRLLLGLPQKTFYGTGSRMGPFRSMEQGALSARQIAQLPEFCTAMSAALSELVREMSPTITRRDVIELPILTLGQQFQGGNNNIIGQQATKGVFLAVREAVEPYIEHATDTVITVMNPRGQRYRITLAGDPDITLQEVVGNSLRNTIAIEIKGGSDRSNQHNRIGEAEKSHQKAKGDGYQAFWTIIRTKTLDMDVARIESPTTDEWFDTAQVGGQQGEDWDTFRAKLLEAIGIKEE